MNEFYNVKRDVLLEGKEYVNVYTISPNPFSTSTIWNFAKQIRQTKLSPFQTDNKCLVVLCNREKEYCKSREELMEVIFELMTMYGFKINDTLTKIYTRNGHSLNRLFVIEKLTS